MIDLYNLWEKFTGEVNTHQGGHIKPNRQFLQYVIDISNSLFEEKFSGGWQKNKKISDDIGRPFLRSVPTKTIDGGASFDLVPYPDFYGHISSARYFHKGDFKACKIKSPTDIDVEVPDDVTEVKIRVVDNGLIGSLSKHRTKKPTLERPYITQYDGGFKIMPKGISYVVLDYFKKPDVPTFEYTNGAGDQIIYNPNSKKLDWPDLVTTEFIQRLKLKYGVFTRDILVYQSASQEKTTIL